jgi:hypothetical protein
MGCIREAYPTMIIDVSDAEFLKNWSSSTRTKVNKAIREQLTVDRGDYLLPDILNLFATTAAVKSLRGYQPEDFHLFPRVECSAIILDGVMLCGHVWVIDEEESRALLHVNATNHRHEHEDTSMTGRAHYFLLWHDGLFLREQSIRTLDLQGYDANTKKDWMKGVYRWKAGTHGEQVEVYHYYPFWFYFVRKLRNWLNV